MHELIQIGPISPLRQRLIDDMTIRRFSRETCFHLPNDRLQPHPNTKTRRPSGMKPVKAVPITADSTENSGSVRNLANYRARSTKVRRNREFFSSLLTLISYPHRF